MQKLVSVENVSFFANMTPPHMIHNLEVITSFTLNFCVKHSRKFDTLDHIAWFKCVVKAAVVFCLPEVSSCEFQSSPPFPFSPPTLK